MTILIAILLFLAVTAATWWFGLWSNLITLINLLIASMVASSIYQPIASYVNSHFDSYALMMDFICVWVCFAITFIVLRSVTDILSGYRMKFDPIVEMFGRSILSAWVAGVFVCFTFFTLQLAPVAPSFFGDDQASSVSDLGTFPDKAWLAFIQSRSRGALSASKTSPLFADYELPTHPDDEGLDVRVFDPFADFLPRARAMRQFISDRPTLRK